MEVEGMLSFSLNPSYTDMIKKGVVIEKPKTEKGKEWYGHVVIRGCMGKVDEGMNTDAYGYKSAYYQLLTIAKKEVPLVSMDEKEQGVKGVADIVASELDKNFDRVLDLHCVQSIVDEFLDMYSYVMAEEKVNLYKLLRLAIKGDKRGIMRIRELVSKFDRLEELLTEVIKNPFSLQKLEEVFSS